jgi:hypothetical protein
MVQHYPADHSVIPEVSCKQCSARGEQHVQCVTPVVTKFHIKICCHRHLYFPLSVFENKVLREIFGPNGGEETGV